jgi:hypothetical protein
MILELVTSRKQNVLVEDHVDSCQGGTPSKKSWSKTGLINDSTKRSHVARMDKHIHILYGGNMLNLFTPQSVDQESDEVCHSY